MTVLISNAGDTVVKLIRDSTLRLGNVTILPGEGNFSGDLKYIINKATFGRIFPGHKSPPAPQDLKKHQSTQSNTTQHITGAIIKTEEANHGQDARGRSRHSILDRDSSPRRIGHHRNNSTFTSQVRRSLSRLRDAKDELPTGTDFHFLLISEIQVLTGHLKSRKPHHYSFEQWAWYLKLMGEDEGNAETHRKAQPKSGHRHHHHHHHHGRGRSPQRGGYGSPDRNDEESPESEGAMAWSWVGNRSPLMGSQEETEWILERLMDRLRESLSAEGRRQLRAETRALGAGHHRPVNGSHHNGHSHEDKEKEKGH